MKMYAMLYLFCTHCSVFKISVNGNLYPGYVIIAQVAWRVRVNPHWTELLQICGR